MAEDAAREVKSRDRRSERVCGVRERFENEMQRSERRVRFDVESEPFECRWGGRRHSQADSS
jgi:hypothetical protein